MEPLRPLGQPNARFAGDDGAPDPITRHALEGARTQMGYIDALIALCRARLLVPVVASGDETAEADPERHAELATVTLTDEEDGLTYLLAFTGLDSLQQWNADARPVPCTLDEVAASVAPAGATRLLIDPAGPVQFVIAGEALEQLAKGFALVQLGEEQYAWVKPEEAPES